MEAPDSWPNLVQTIHPGRIYGPKSAEVASAREVRAANR
jgi:hypothetical protein